MFEKVDVIGGIDRLWDSVNPMNDWREKRCIGIIALMVKKG
jgi:hypothetical protein